VTDYTFTVTVRCATLDQARQVMAERIGHDEDYGFPYEVDWHEQVVVIDFPGTLEDHEQAARRRLDSPRVKLLSHVVSGRGVFTTWRRA
jgi:hypothetical protein